MNKMQMTLHFNTAADILKHKFAGNAFDDMPAFMGIMHFVRRDDVTNEDRLAVLNYEYVEGMGLEPITMEELPEVMEYMGK